MKKIFVRFTSFNDVNKSQAIILNCTEDEIKTVKRFALMCNGCVDAEVLPTQIEISDVDAFNGEYTLSEDF